MNLITNKIFQICLISIQFWSRLPACTREQSQLNRPKDALKQTVFNSFEHINRHTFLPTVLVQRSTLPLTLSCASIYCWVVFRCCAPWKTLWLILITMCIGFSHVSPDTHVLACLLAYRHSLCVLFWTTQTHHVINTFYYSIEWAIKWKETGIRANMCSS